ncbi:MAG: hypothetical protein M0R33_17015 [Methylomonas sp.]|jgi:hypothetical protein|uniref:hypothetical protein n=1 Tax=Methylomonas sp. TaxID=418 RepID=UPI0025D30A06|nr:hypothetical protein [Methylomonas sp.]MCK9608147.1 hypothetical protein [Methylomonas sp.]
MEDDFIAYEHGEFCTPSTWRAPSKTQFTAEMALDSANRQHGQPNEEYAERYPPTYPPRYPSSSGYYAAPIQQSGDGGVVEGFSSGSEIKRTPFGIDERIIIFILLIIIVILCYANLTVMRQIMTIIALREK